MATRIRTLNFLPDVFKTPTNGQFLAATLDQIVQQPETMKVEGYVGSRLGNGVNAKDYYVVEPTKVRKDYQLDPGIIFKNPEESSAKDFISYPGIIDAIRLQNGITGNNDRLFNSEFYSWDSFADLDKLINFSQYYWIPEGPASVIVSSETIFNTNDYIVNDLTNGYNIVPSYAEIDTNIINPSIALLRGGTYTFNVNQDSQFWIQGVPGITGYSLTQPNIQTREIYGVQNNGISQGIITFTVPQKDAQGQYDFPGSNTVDVISSLPFSQVNNQEVTGFDIDGVTDLEGLRVMFYNTGESNEVGYVSNYFSLGNYKTVTVTATNGITNRITCLTTSNLSAGNPIIFTGSSFGNLLTYSAVIPDTIYFVESVVSATEFTISQTQGGSTYALLTATGNMQGLTNNGDYEIGYDTIVNQNFYTIQYVFNPQGKRVTRLVPSSEIPVSEKITANYGSQYITRNFYRDSFGNIQLVPYISAPLDTLYYQDGTTASKVGVIKIVENNVTNTLDVEQEILGRKQYRSTNGVSFTNGLKVSFRGDVIPKSYLDSEYYVQGVGTAIQLLPVQDFSVPEKFTSTIYDPWDVLGYDSTAWEGNANIPMNPDYITIARNSLDKNAWSRSNRWFHIDVINATATYNNNENLITAYTSDQYKAKRPIIEFYPNLKLYNYGTEGKNPIDFIDVRTTDAFSIVAGKENYCPDIEVYTDYSCSIDSTQYLPERVIQSASDVTGIFTTDEGYFTTGFRVNDEIILKNLPENTGLTSGGAYYVAEIVSSTEFKISSSKNGEVVIPSIAISGVYDFVWYPQSTIITIPANKVMQGTFVVGQYLLDTNNVLPNNAQIIDISGSTTLTLTVDWDQAGVYFDSQTNVSIVASDTSVYNYALFDGATVIFTKDTDPQVRNKIYQARFSTTTDSSSPVITLTEIENGTILPDNTTVAIRGYLNSGKQFYFDGIDYIESQQKDDVNQPPLFDIYDNNNISFGNAEIYSGTSFKGSKLFAYGIGEGINDSILGFPIRYSSVDNLGDISFDVSLNLDTFNYVVGTEPVTQKINTGYVFSYITRELYKREIGWQTAVSPSLQYQVFEFTFDPLVPVLSYECDISKSSDSSTKWPTILVYINNRLLDSTEYTVTTTDVSTIVTLLQEPIIETVIQILLVSDQVSKTAYYTIPLNLNNNPLNTDITTANVGDIRGQYQSMFYNNPDTTGEVFGSNNFRDLGNMVPWGNKIIQNSASLVLPGMFLRDPQLNLLNALQFNSREYVKFKNLLVYVVQNTDYPQRYDPSQILDDALDQITSSKTEDQPFFWSDMLPGKAAYKVNTYTFANSLDTSIFPLDKIYDYSQANYNGVLVYLTRKTNNITYTLQLYKDIDYTISSTNPSLTVTKDLLQGDKITIKQYNQTYGSYVPNTPAKLGLYPLSVPQVVLDENYSIPTYFIKGHDGSYTKLYGDYDIDAGFLIDYRDQALLEFEQRIYNNIKLSTNIPIPITDVVPGSFRDTKYSYAEWLSMYSIDFLDWIGQNRLDYKTQFYNKTNPFTYNYYQSSNKLNGQVIEQGYWRGIYQYLFDTTTPESTPWEMLGLTDKPTWWEERYGPAPYTSDNIILWNDLSEGFVYNNGLPYIDSAYARPGLLDIIPVDSSGNLLDPLSCVIGSFNENLFQRSWKVGDDASVELSYRRSSTYPFMVVKLMALMFPARFYNLAVDLDNYKYNDEFDQYLFDNRSHLRPENIQVYGNGIAKTSYINWIIDYEKQQGINATDKITTLLDNLDVRLVYRLAGFSDKVLLKFYVEKGSPNNTNASLLIPDESFDVLLYENQPFNRLVYSSVIVQITQENGMISYSVFGNSQTNAYFNTLKPKYTGTFQDFVVENLTVRVTKDHFDTVQIVPYGTRFNTVKEVSQFLSDYGAYLETQGMKYEQQENGLLLDWNQMISEFMYWAQMGWEIGSVITLNPSAKIIKIEKENHVVQPLTMQQTNFVLNQNLYVIQTKDLAIVREGIVFNLAALNDGDTLSYGQFNLSNIEHGIVFDNVTIFDDVIYNLVTGLRQNRIILRGTKSAEWNGLVDAAGFIYNQDNIKEWSKSTKYSKGEIVKYKNKYWIAVTLVQANNVFVESEWKRTDYDEIQKGLLPNPSTRSYESTLYYDVNQANLELDADLLSFSLIGFRPRDYMAYADLTDITQVNVYKNLIKNKGTKNSVDAFKGANLPQGGIQYDVYENWAIKTGEFGGVLNNNFIEFKLRESDLTGNPAYVGLTDGQSNVGVEQEIPLYSLFNYGRPITEVNVLPTISPDEPSLIFPDAGYVNFNDVKMSAYFFSQLPFAININGVVQPIETFYVRDYVWVANFKQRWEVFTPTLLGNVVSVQNNLNDTVTINFEKPHNLRQYQPFVIINFNININGYYVAIVIVNPYTVLINKTLDQSISTLNGQGIALLLSSQRVDTPADINNTRLLDFEFTKNTVWVDTNTDGSWGVYRKDINFDFEKQFTQTASQSLGNAVAILSDQSYLISDSDDNKVYRFSYNELTKSYEITQTLTGTGKFGSSISYSQDLYSIVAPDDNLVKIYQFQTNRMMNGLVEIQTISTTSPAITRFSGDQKWLYIGRPSDNTVEVYQQFNIDTVAGYFVIGQTYTITAIGSTDFMAIGATDNLVGIDFIATGIGTGTGTATKITYRLVETIDADSLGLTTPGDSFGYSISTDYYGNNLTVGAPNKDIDTISNWGYSYIFNRTVQNIEVQTNSQNYIAQIFTLAWTPVTTTKTVSATTGSSTFTITLNSTTGLTVNDPVIFTTSGTGLQDTNIVPYVTYYIHTVVDATDIKIKTTRDTTDVYEVTTDASVTAILHVQDSQLFVYKNGKLVEDQNYGIAGSNFVYSSDLTAGDILTVSGQNFVLHQELTTQENPQIGSQFGYSIDTNTSGNEILIGAPYQLNTQIEEGTVYRYTNGGMKYGYVVGTTNCNVTSGGILLINGYLVYIPVGNASTVAYAINSSRVTNITASDDNGKLVISLVNQTIAQTNNKLVLSALSTSLLSELGIVLYRKTQEIYCPHRYGPTQFGSAIKMNEFDSVAISAPVGTRYLATVFDFSDDQNQDNDTVFDNNATQFIDQTPNFGAVYIFDYLQQYNESILNPGKYIYAQSVNSLNVINTAFNSYNQQNDVTISNQPYYGKSIDFNRYIAIIGSPNDTGATTGYEYAGSVTTYKNLSGKQNWSLHRYSSPVVDIDRIYNIQLFSAEMNTTLINLDYIDPLQGKILGAARENIDIISNSDPASYNNDTIPGNIVWGAAQVGTIWLDTTNMRYVNYHQNDSVSYNGEYWGSLFPGSDIAVYTWIATDVLPGDYTGSGTPLQDDFYSVQFYVDSTGSLVPTYYYWVRDTGTIYADQGKTLSDTAIAFYIENPRASGISYLVPVLPSVFGLVNSNEYFNANDTVLHIGFATGTNDDVSHEQVNLIRAGYPDDFLPGIPLEPAGVPISLYDRLLDSTSGVDELGQVVPNPYLPKAVQIGVLARPRQSFFYNRFVALQNYIQYANTVMSQYPIIEIRQNLSFLFEKNPEITETIVAGNCQAGTTYTIVTLGDVDWTSMGASSNEVGVTFVATGPATGEYKNTGTASFVAFAEGTKYDTTNYWEYINWWATGYNDSTRSNFQVEQYADLSTLPAKAGTIATVNYNGAFKAETYVYDATSNWVLIGIDNGTIRFKTSIYDYTSSKLGFGDNFFDTTPYDIYPSQETRNIVRAINEQIFDEDLLVHRNKSLILLFEYIQSETSENQNYLPWLNKTSFIDVSHTIRELRPIQVFQNDNQEFLSGYINEVKPYHVVIKEFLFKYTGIDTFAGDITDFDLPSRYNSTIQQFVTPQLVYVNPNNIDQFLPSSSIWNDNDYKMWYENNGLSIGIPETINGAVTYIGEKNYELSILETYLATNTPSFAVSNAQGFPTNGVIKIGAEKIAYSIVDRTYNVISGLTRGVDGTVISSHIPGTTVYMDLPAVIVLDGGSGYVNPPIVTAYIDTSIYPAPTKQAVLTPVMSLDTVLSITVTDPGEGYAVLPEIRIEPSKVITFSSTDVSVVSSTIRLYAPLLQTGQLIKYRVGAGTTPIPGLKDNSWYYINVLETVPTVSIGLYKNSSDALLDHDRVILYGTGTGNNHSFNVGARAIAVSNNTPIRENIITLRFDRTTYNSKLVNWTPGTFYGAYYSGQFGDSDKLASSALLLQSTRPPISTILASAQGIAFEIVDVRNDSIINYSSFVRYIESTSAIDNTLRLVLQDDGSGNPNASGSTIGFYIGMPVKFDGANLGTFTKIASATSSIDDTIVLDSVSDIKVNDLVTFIDTIANIIPNKNYYVLTIDTINSTITISETLGGSTFILTTDTATCEVTIGGVRFGMTYYVSNIVNQTDFNVSMTPLGSSIYLATDIATTYVDCYTGDLDNIGVIEVNYPGILPITNTFNVTNKIVTPLNPTGTGGTQGFYIGLPIFFTGTLPDASNNGVFGGIVENQPYFVTTIVDDETFTISVNKNPQTFTVVSTVASNDTVIIDGDTSLLNVEEPVIFNTMIIAGVETTNFGGLIAGETYYIADIISSTSFTIATEQHGAAVSLTDVTSASDTAALMTSQKDTVQLTNGNTTTNTNYGMVVNVDLPVSPGQIDGQLFTLYQTSGQYPALVGTDGNLILRNVMSMIGKKLTWNADQLIEGIEYEIVTVGTTDFTLLGAASNSIGVIFTANDSYTGTGTGTVTEVVNRVVLTQFVEGNLTKLDLTNIYLNMPVEISETVGTGFLSSTTTYYVVDKGFVEVIVTETSSINDILRCESTASLSLDMPITFTGTSIGGVYVNVQFFVKEIVNETDFKISDTENGSVFTVISETGVMIGTGMPYIKVSATSGGTSADPGNTQQSASISVATPAVVTVDNAPDDGIKVIFRNGTLPTGISANVTYYVRNSTGTTFNLSLAPASALINTTGSSGSTTMIVDDQLQIDQTPTAVAEFDASYILGGYRVVITDPGEGYAVDNTITIQGTMLGGTSPLNDLVLTVNNIDIDGKITQVICSGTVPAIPEQYYLKVINSNEFELYQDKNLLNPISGLTLPFVGISQSSITNLDSSTDKLTVSDITLFDLNDAVVFTGDIPTNTLTVITPGQPYYIVSISGSDITISDIPGGTIVNLPDTTATDFSIAKSGSFALLPEPVVFNQSIVKFNNRVYSCIISNNDQEFVFGKWELMTSGDRRLNALDRVIGYYAPTDNMPGVDLSQLFEGITYPNNTYLGNAFAPDMQYPLDTILQDLPFYPNDTDLTSVVWNGLRYITTANMPNYSSIVTSITGNDWQINKLAGVDINLSDIIYSDGYYLITSTNRATPLFRSQNGVDFTTAGFYTPYGSEPYDSTNFDVTAVSIDPMSLNSVAHAKSISAAVLIPGRKYIITDLGTTDWNFISDVSSIVYRVGDLITVVYAGYGTGTARLYDNSWVAVGNKIISSEDTYIWDTYYDFEQDEFLNELFGVEYINVPYIAGYIAVGKVCQYSTTEPSQIETVSDLVLKSFDGIDWTRIPKFSTKGLYAVADNGTVIVAVGEDGVIYNSYDGTSWQGINRTNVLSSNPVTKVLNVGNTSGLLVDDVVRFNNAFDAISTSTDYYVFEVASPSELKLSNSSLSTAAGSIVAGVYQITNLGTTDWNIVAGTVAVTYAVGDIITAVTSGTGSGNARELIDFTGLAVPDNTELFKYPLTSTLLDLIYKDGIFMAVGISGRISTSSDGLTWTEKTSSTTETLRGVFYNADDSKWIVVGDNNTIILSDDTDTWVSSSVFELPVPAYTVQGDAFTFGYGPEELVPGLITDNVMFTVATRPGTNWEAPLYAHVGYNVVSIELSPESGTQVEYNFDVGQLYNIPVPAQIAVYVIDGSSDLCTAVYDTIDYTVDWANFTVILNTPLSFIPVSDRLRIDIYEVGNGNQLVKANTNTDALRINTTTGYNEIYVNCNYTGQLYEGSGVIQPDSFPIEADATETISAFNTITVTDINKFTLNDAISFQGAVFGNIQEDVVYYVKTISIFNNTITVSDQQVGGIAGPTFVLSDATGLMRVIIRPGAGGTWTAPIVLCNGVKLLVGTNGTVTRTKSSNNAVTCNTTVGLNVGDKITFSDTMFGPDITPFTVYYVKSIVDANEFTISTTLGGTTLTLTDATGGAQFVSNDYAFGIQPNGISAKIIFARGDYDPAQDYIVYSLFGETLFTQYGYTLPETQLIEGDGTTGPYLLDNYVGGDNPDNAIVEVNGLRITPDEYTIDFSNSNLTFVSLAPAISDMIAVTSYNLTDRQYLNTQYGIAGTTSDYVQVTEIAYIDNVITPSQPAVRVTTSSAHGLSTNDVVRIDGTGGSVQLNNNTFYVNVISATELDLYSTPYDSTPYAVNYPVTNVSTYIIGSKGYVWLADSYVIFTETVTSTTFNPLIGYYITVDSTQQLVEGTPVIFTGTSFGNIQVDTKYYIKDIINSTDFNISNTYGGEEVVLSNASVILSSVSITGTAGQFSCADPNIGLTTGLTVTISGTNTGTGSITGYTNPTTYYIVATNGSTTFTLSTTDGGSGVVTTAGTTTGLTFELSARFRVSQWEQDDVARLWVTVEGYKIPSSSLRLNANNRLSILTPIDAGDTVVITSMMPSATPNEEVYLMNINAQNQGTVYRANTQTRTWLTQALTNTQDTIYVYDVTRLTDVKVIDTIAPVAVDNIYSIGLTVDKNTISSVTVFNNTTGQYISDQYYNIVIESLSPILKITGGIYISNGDSLTITVLEGNLLYVNGEQIKFTTIDFLNNSISGLQRGTNGTGEQEYIPIYAEVFGILSNNRLSNADYSKTWNSDIYNTTDGDPLQISVTESAIFLRGDVS